MVEATRALLDELMGKDRNVPLSMKKTKDLKFYDPHVCKFELGGLCPYTLFKNTKSDLGPCQYEIHREHVDWEIVEKQWNELSDKEKYSYRYEKDLFRFLNTLVTDMDRKIARSKERAEKESQPRELKPEEQLQLNDIQQKVKAALEKSQELGEAGDIDGSLIFSQQAETFKLQMEGYKATFCQPERTMTVCEVCGVFINSTDNEQRRKDHLNGKQYMGWKSIRECHKRLKDRVEKAELERRREKEKLKEEERKALELQQQQQKELQEQQQQQQQQLKQEEDQKQDQKPQQDADQQQQQQQQQQQPEEKSERYRRKRSRSPRRRSSPSGGGGGGDRNGHYYHHHSQRRRYGTSERRRGSGSNRHSSRRY